MQEIEYFVQCNALGYDVRWCIVHILLERDGTANVVELTDALALAGYPITQSVVSSHLRVLRQAGLITYTRSGLEHFYTVKRSALSNLAREIAQMAERAEKPELLRA